MQNIKATLALKLMTEMVRAQASGRPAKVMRVKRRLDKVLAAAKARALATSAFYMTEDDAVALHAELGRHRGPHVGIYF